MEQDRRYLISQSNRGYHANRSTLIILAVFFFISIVFLSKHFAFHGILESR